MPDFFFRKRSLRPLCLLVPVIIVPCACGSVSEGAPPTRICGTIMPSGGAGVIPTRIPTGEGATLRTLSLAVGNPGPAIYAVATSGCVDGARVVISPKGIVGLDATARADDGLVAGFELKGIAPGAATVTVSRSGQVLGVIPVRVAR
jgi:hypothetical protein